MDVKRGGLGDFFFVYIMVLGRAGALEPVFWVSRPLVRFFCRRVLYLIPNVAALLLYCSAVMFLSPGVGAGSQILRMGGLFPGSKTFAKSHFSGLKASVTLRS